MGFRARDPHRHRLPPVVATHGKKPFTRPRAKYMSDQLTTSAGEARETLGRLKNGPISGTRQEGFPAMHARVVNVQFQSGTVDEASRIVRESIAPAMKEQQGFKGQLLSLIH